MIHRIEVRARGKSDPQGNSIAQQIAELGIAAGNVRSSRIYLLDSDATNASAVAAELLADPIADELIQTGDGQRIEIHLKPGVMDPVAASTELALRDRGVAVREVRTGRAYTLEHKLDDASLKMIAARLLANGVIESVHFENYTPTAFAVGRETAFQLRHVLLTHLADTELMSLSRDGHLFLSLAEMYAVQRYFREQGREPTDIELETIAQTWSEHCVHKTLKSAVDVIDESGKIMRHYDNLIGETIFASTMHLIKADKADFCLSVFKDNAGVIAFDDVDAVCFKVETHNHPSAIEPYGGAATGVGGVIRDVLATGLGAKPIANTDGFCVGNVKSRLAVVGSQREEDHIATHNPLPTTDVPKGIIHAKRVLQQVVAGVRDYGNRMGIPTVNGFVYFDSNYIANPLVFCGCAGIIPRDKIHKAARAGDLILVMGGRTGRDGIHGATFSSAELTNTHADEFSHAVQIGNAITEKKVADVLLAARDRGLFTSVTDCGAGGLSSAVGEMGEKLGARVDLDLVPLKYAGLRYDEIWISEAQERMVLAVPPEHIEALLELSRDENVESTVIGEFGTTNAELILNYRGNEVGRLSMAFLHDGLPKTTRKARVPSSLSPYAGKASSLLEQSEQKENQRSSALPSPRVQGERESFSSTLLRLLAHPNIASKHWIIRQYDHEVGGGSVIKPLVGPLQIGPSDAAVIRPKFDSYRGVAIACGLAPQIEDPYEMSLAAIDEAIRNVIAVGADYEQIAILDNFCWPSVDDEITMGTLVRTCEACRDAALAYGIPFISGKDSLHNQYTDRETGRVIRIPRTLLISAIGVVPDIRRCVAMDFKRTGNGVFLIAAHDDLSKRAATHRELGRLIAEGHIAACHDVSDGGYAVAAAEMAIASGIGVSLDPDLFETHDPFAEWPGRYLIELSATAVATMSGEQLDRRFESFGNATLVGFTQSNPDLVLANRSQLGSGKRGAMIPVDQLTQAWRSTLDW